MMHGYKSIKETYMKTTWPVHVGWILLTFVIIIALIFLWSNKITPSSTKISQVTFGYDVDTNNTRIKQWLHFWSKVDMHEDSASRAFYYDQIVSKFVNAGFDIQRARIYAEIPGVECSWDQLRHPETSSAKGLWQFTKDRAEQLGLDVRPDYDERLNPSKATDAAIDGFFELENAFNHDLVKILFAYHGGTGVVTEMQRDFKTNNAWYYEFPNRETYDFAPKVLALAYYQFQKDNGKIVSEGNQLVSNSTK